MREPLRSITSATSARHLAKNSNGAGSLRPVAREPALELVDDPAQLRVLAEAAGIGLAPAWRILERLQLRQEPLVAFPRCPLEELLLAGTGGAAHLEGQPEARGGAPGLYRGAEDLHRALMGLRAPLAAHDLVEHLEALLPELLLEHREDLVRLLVLREGDAHDRGDGVGADGSSSKGRGVQPRQRQEGLGAPVVDARLGGLREALDPAVRVEAVDLGDGFGRGDVRQIGRASCRERAAREVGAGGPEETDTK